MCSQILLITSPRPFTYINKHSLVILMPLAPLRSDQNPQCAMKSNILIVANPFYCQISLMVDLKYAPVEEFRLCTQCACIIKKLIGSCSVVSLFQLVESFRKYLRNLKVVIIFFKFRVKFINDTG